MNFMAVGRRFERRTDGVGMESYTHTQAALAQAPLSGGRFDLLSRFAMIVI